MYNWRKSAKYSSPHARKCTASFKWNENHYSWSTLPDQFCVELASLQSYVCKINACIDKRLPTEYLVLAHRASVTLYVNPVAPLVLSIQVQGCRPGTFPEYRVWYAFSEQLGLQNAMCFFFATSEWPTSKFQNGSSTKFSARVLYLWIWKNNVCCNS